MLPLVALLGILAGILALGCPRGLGRGQEPAAVAELQARRPCSPPPPLALFGLLFPPPPAPRPLQ